MSYTVEAYTKGDSKIVYPKFSVLITVYEKENPNFLDASLASIENQSIKPNEIVLVKDGPLNSELDKIIEKHSSLFKKQYKVIKSNKNRGRGAASQLGLSFVTNKWVARMDSDDISLPKRFELQLKNIIEDSEIKVIGGQIKEFENDPEFVIGERRVPTKSDDIKLYAQYRSPVNNPTVMMNTQAIRNIGGYSTANILEDYDLYVRMLTAGYKIVNTPEVLVKMRVDSGLYSRRGGKRYLLSYIKMKNTWRKMGIGTVKTMIISDISMLLNVLLPVSFRKLIYQKFLHRNKK
ncbi:glycosyltransferase [Limosilactobacillus reuteri]|uniref:glycosyltransferase n=1 Tax=Limosilactobacillus reuteri TaxID=1598 RepID=UPI00226EE97E|nr:glycosyltransferase [Limosilactobacillus reuteri]MCC4424767.1 glycosyltransferase [Limosilactobacillus reuteri]